MLRIKIQTLKTEKALPEVSSPEDIRLPIKKDTTPVLFADRDTVLD